MNSTDALIITLQEDKARAQRRDKRKETKKKKFEDPHSTAASNDGQEDDMAAIMGFSGFGSSKKQTGNEDSFSFVNFNKSSLLET